MRIGDTLKVLGALGSSLKNAEPFQPLAELRVRSLGQHFFRDVSALHEKASLSAPELSAPTIERVTTDEWRASVQRALDPNLAQSELMREALLRVQACTLFPHDVGRLTSQEKEEGLALRERITSEAYADLRAPSNNLTLARH
jgi:hypothetical protein